MISKNLPKTHFFLLMNIFRRCPNSYFFSVTHSKEIIGKVSGKFSYNISEEKKLYLQFLTMKRRFFSRQNISKLHDYSLYEALFQITHTIPPSYPFPSGLPVLPRVPAAAAGDGAEPLLRRRWHSAHRLQGHHDRQPERAS